MKTISTTKEVAARPSNGEALIADQRQREATLMTLVELDPQLVVDGRVTRDGYEAQEVDVAGAMREACPYCPREPLQLVLRRKHVIRSHLFCKKCTRCFDAIKPDGSSVFFSMPVVSLD